VKPGNVILDGVDVKPVAVPPETPPSPAPTARERIYDAVIVGASFAGLAAARRLGENVVILDRKAPGAGQASSCGAPLPTMSALGAEEAVLQIHDELVIHTRDDRCAIPLDPPFCTFDYERFANAMLRQVRARIVRANVRGVDGMRVLTDDAAYEGRALIDASGWRAALGSLLAHGLVDRRWLFCGVETEVAVRERGLHFFIEPQGVKDTLGWIFPCGRYSRVGIGSYVGRHPLGRHLDAFLEKLGFTGGARHGGFFPSALRAPTAGHAFLVGDAAGQCYPLSGEGIRPAVYFGDHCGRLVRDVVEGRSGYVEALDAYAAEVRRRRWSFRIMRALQNVLLALPPTGQATLVRLVSPAPIRIPLEWGYNRAIPSAHLAC
jgi:flavin-dependent dehydrogenase